MMNLVVDYRERACISYLEGENVDFQKENLPVADFCFRDGGGTDIVYIERKTYPDLLSSIKDGRWRNQKMRMMQSGSAAIIYIIEGDLEDVDQTGQSVCLGAISNAVVRDGLVVMGSADPEGTCRLCRVLMSKVAEFGIGSLQRKSTSGHDYVETLVRNKSKNLTTSNCFRAMLAQVPGLSPLRAKVIMDEYPNFRALMDAYGSCDSEQERVEMLSNLKSKGRRLGSILSRKVYCYLHGIEFQ